MLRSHALAGLLACSFLLLGSAASAQIDTGVIVGRVVDDSGGVLPGVTVTATQQGTGLALIATTNERGEYIFPGLRVGAYDVTAELQGFRRRKRRRPPRMSLSTSWPLLPKLDRSASLAGPGRTMSRPPAAASPSARASRLSRRNTNREGPTFGSRA